MKPKYFVLFLTTLLVLTAALLRVHSTSAYATCCKWGTNNASYKYGPTLPSSFYRATDDGANQWTKTEASWYWIVNAPNSSNWILYGPVDLQGEALANTTRWVSQPSNTIVKIEMKYDSAENWYTGTKAPASNQADAMSVAAHEFGHALGLNHTQSIPHCPSDSLAATMCRSLPYGSRHIRTLEADDRNGVYNLYP